MKQYLKLFWTFFKIGLFTFGGGYAMISLIHKECVEANKWIEDDDMNNIIAIAESTPGPISINASTFIGYKTGKFLGACFATLGVILPSFVIIVLVSIFINYFNDSLIIKYAFEGIRASIIILMIEAIFKLSKPLNKNAIFYSLLLTSFILNFFFKVNAIFIILIGMILGIVRELIFNKKVNENVWFNKVIFNIL